MLEVFQTISGLTELLFQVLQSKVLVITKCDERLNSTPNALRATRSSVTFNRLNIQRQCRLLDNQTSDANIAV